MTSSGPSLEGAGGARTRPWTPSLPSTPVPPLPRMLSPKPCGVHDPFGLPFTEALRTGAAQPVPRMRRSRPRGKIKSRQLGWGLPPSAHPSFSGGHSRLGPRTMAMLLGVILFTSCSSARRARNFIRYLGRREADLGRGWGIGPWTYTSASPRRKTVLSRGFQKVAETAHRLP